jgi:hypothetical protein
MTILMRAASSDVFRSKGPTATTILTGNGRIPVLMARPNGPPPGAIHAQAEYMLVNEAAAIAPIYYYTTQQLTQTYVTRGYAADRLERFNTWDINR